MTADPQLPAEDEGSTPNRLAGLALFSTPPAPEFRS